jgi:WD40 repeat protein/transcriptional regulator with XRE-family HTH domain
VSSSEPIPLDEFRGLLLRFRGRMGLSQSELARRVGVHLRSVQGWEAGVSLPGAERLKSLVQVVLDEGAFTQGAEFAEAQALWTAAQLASSRSVPPFESRWFADLLAQRSRPASHASAAASHPPAAAPQAPPATPATAAAPAAPSPPVGTRAQDWGDAPDTFGFVGRAAELQLLAGWLTRDRVRLLVLRGIGGIGKTMLAARIAREAAPRFKSAYWRSLRNAPAFAEWSAGAITFLSDHQRPPPESPNARLDALLELLQATPTLLVLDNLEVLLEPGRGEGQFRAGHETYGDLIRLLGQSAHQSCLLLTSREVPQEVSVAEGAAAGVLVMELAGLPYGDARVLLSDKRLDGDDAAWAALVTHYAGNPLALRIVGETIQQVFGGDIERFVEQAGSLGAFGGIRRLLEAQFDRLSPIEREVLQVLAIEREPLSFLNLAGQLAPRATRSAALEGVEALRHRSLLERIETSAAFGLQSVVLEYVTDGLVASGVDEIASGEFHLLANRALIRAQAPDHVRQTQERLIGQPILDQLALTSAGPDGVERRLLEVLDEERARPLEQHGFAPGNVINLLRLARGNLRAADMSRLSIRQAYLQDVEAQDANLTTARLIETVLDDSFGAVGAVAISADSARIGAGTLGGAVRVWRMADRAPLLGARPTSGGIWGVALSADGRVFARGSLDATVELWDVDSGGRLPFGLHQDSPVTRIELSQDATLLVTTALDGIVRVWDVATGQLVQTAEGHRGAVYGLALSLDGELMATGGIDGIVRLWDLRTGHTQLQLAGQTGTIWSVSVDQSAGLIASGGQDGTVRLWETSSGVLVRTLGGHTGAVRAVALSSDGEMLATGGFDGTLRLWEPRTGRRLATVVSHSGGVRGVAISRDGQTIVSGGFDASVRVWNAKSALPLATLQGHTAGVRAVSVSAQGRPILASGGPDAHVQLWELDSGRLLTTLEHGAASVRAVVLRHDGAVLASAGLDSTVRVWDAKTGRVLRALEGHAAAVLALAMSPNGELLASGGLDSTVRLWAPESGALLALLEGHGGAVWCAALSGDGRITVSGGLDGSVRVWDTRTGQQLARLQGHVGGVRSVSLSADGRTMASAGDDGSVRVWDATGGVCTAVLQGHTASVYGVSMSPDGHTIASGSTDRTVRLWSAHTFQPLGVLEGHTDAVYTVAFGNDGQLLASGGLDATVRLWSVSDGQPIRTLHPDRRYERMDITELTGITDAQRGTLVSLGATSR